MELRKMMRKDIKEIVAIEEENGDFPLNDIEVLAYLRSPITACYVLTYENGEDGDNNIAGYIISSIKDTMVIIHRIGINRTKQRLGVGTKLYKHLKAKSGRGIITMMVREHNLPLQLFLKKHGFFAVETKKDHFGTEDGYIMKWRAKE